MPADARLEGVAAMPQPGQGDCSCDLPIREAQLETPVIGAALTHRQTVRSRVAPSRLNTLPTLMELFPSNQSAPPRRPLEMNLAQTTSPSRSWPLRSVTFPPSSSSKS